MSRNPLTRINPKYTTRLIAVLLAALLCLGVYRVFIVEGGNVSEKPGNDLNGTPDNNAENIDNSTGGETENDADNDDEQNIQDSDSMYKDNGAEVLRNQLSAQSAILCNNLKNTVISKKSEKTPVTSAAVLSLSVALTVMEAIAVGEISPSDRAVCPASAIRLPCYQSSSSIISVGQSLTVAELVKCMLCADPWLYAHTLAIHTGGGEQAFLDRMNALMRDLGVKNTFYRSVSDPNAQSTTALDAAVIFRAAMENQTLRSLLTTSQSFTVSASGNAWNTFTLCNRFYSECCTEGQARADGIVGGYYCESEGKEFVFMLFEQGGVEHITVAMCSDTAYADSLILLSRALR